VSSPRGPRDPADSSPRRGGGTVPPDGRGDPARAAPPGAALEPHGVVPSLEGVQEFVEPDVVDRGRDRGAPPFTRACALIARTCLQVGVFGLVLLLAAVIWQVFGRYVLNNTPTWAESLALLLVLYVTMLGCAVGVRDAGHIGMELIGPLLPERLHLPMAILIHVLTLAFGALMAWNCGLMLESVSGYKIPTLGISESFRYVPLIAAGVLIMLFSVEHIVALVKGVEVEKAWH
jgi:TRAP-type C4-dicarboxylate transport system permease small subunit